MEAEEREVKLEALARLAVAVSREPKDCDVFRLGAEFLVGAFDNVCHLSIALLSKNEDTLYFFELSTEVGGTHKHIGSMPLDDTASGKCIRERRMVCEGEFRISGRRYLDYLHFSHEGAVCFVTAPLLVAEKVLGTVNLGSMTPHAYVGKLHIIEGFAGLLSPIIGLQRFTRELVGVKALLQRVLPTCIMDRVEALHEYPPPAPGALSTPAPQPAAVSPSPAPVPFVLDPPALDPRIVAWRQRLAEEAEESDSSDAAVTVTPAYAVPRLARASASVTCQQEFMDSLLEVSRSATDACCSVITLILLLALGHWEYRPGPDQWLVVLTCLLGLLASLPIVAYFSSSFRGFYSRQREVILPVLRVMQAILLAARLRAADPISRGSSGSPVFISTDALLALQSLGYQVHFPRETAVMLSCSFAVVPAIYHFHGLGSRASHHEMLLLFVIVWCLPTVLTYLTSLRSRRNLQRLQACAADADVAHKQKLKVADAPSSSAAAVPPDDWVLVPNAAPAAPRPVFAGAANTAAVPSMSRWS